MKDSARGQKTRLAAAGALLDSDGTTRSAATDMIYLYIELAYVTDLDAEGRVFAVFDTFGCGEMETNFREGRPLGSPGREFKPADPLWVDTTFSHL